MKVTVLTVKLKKYFEVAPLFNMWEQYPRISSRCEVAYKYLPITCEAYIRWLITTEHFVKILNLINLYLKQNNEVKFYFPKAFNFAESLKGITKMVILYHDIALSNTNAC